jgi:hypothetical protein
MKYYPKDAELEDKNVGLNFLFYHSKSIQNHQVIPNQQREFKTQKNFEISNQLWSMEMVFHTDIRNHQAKVEGMEWFQKAGEPWNFVEILQYR